MIGKPKGEDSTEEMKLLHDKTNGCDGASEELRRNYAEFAAEITQKIARNHACFSEIMQKSHKITQNYANITPKLRNNDARVCNLRNLFYYTPHFADCRCGVGAGGAKRRRGSRPGRGSSPLLFEDPVEVQLGDGGTKSNMGGPVGPGR